MVRTQQTYCERLVVTQCGSTGALVSQHSIDAKGPLNASAVYIYCVALDSPVIFLIAACHCQAVLWLLRLVVLDLVRWQQRAHNLCQLGMTPSLSATRCSQISNLCPIPLLCLCTFTDPRMLGSVGRIRSSNRMTIELLCEFSDGSPIHQGRSTDMQRNIYRFYLSFAHDCCLGWSATLHEGRKDGTAVFKMIKTSVSVQSARLEISIRSMHSRWTTELIQSPFPGSSHSFIGPDGHEYHWKWRSNFSFSNDLQASVLRAVPYLHLYRTLTMKQCVDSWKVVVAIYRCRSMALYKDGQLTIFPVREIASLCQYILCDRNCSLTVWRVHD